MQPSATPPEDIRLRDACPVASMGKRVAFPPAALAEIEQLFTRYPVRRAVVLPALWIAQREFGWISREVIEEVARICEIAPSDVYGVVSFYTMFNRAPKGRHHLQLCTNLSCQLRGAEHILDCLKQKLGIGLGGTTSDGLFSLDEVECLAACDLAPAMQVNDDYVGPLSAESAAALIDRLRASAPQSAAPQSAAPRAGAVPEREATR